MDLTNEDVADILALLDSLPYDELDLQTSRFRLTLRRTPAGWTQSEQISAEPVVIPYGEGPPRGVASASERAQARFGEARGAPEAKREGPCAARPEDTAGTPEGGGSGGLVSTPREIAVTAPLPGTFYRAPRPGAAPFTEVGALVTEDTVVAIVETMKLMNPVHAGNRGRIAAILVGNAEAVARGAVLMRIQPSPGGATPRTPRGPEDEQ